jgi:Polyketide cyclase / dehydrase and lipid transport
MVKHILIGSGALVVALAGVVAAQEPAFRVERSTTIAAPPEKAFALVNDFRAWGAWSPYEKLDPEMKRTFNGSQAGTGAVYEWAGSKSGVGRMKGRKNFVAKALHLFFDVDRIVGGDFEKGLLAMKSAVEAPPTENTQAKAP